jgi:hypothetical protein
VARRYGQQRETKDIPDPAQGLGQQFHCNKTPAYKDDTSLFSFLKNTIISLKSTANFSIVKI